MTSSTGLIIKINKKMKHFLLVTFLVFQIVNVVSAQDSHKVMNNFFRNDKNMLEWRIIRETSMSRGELIDAIIESGFFEEIDITGEKVVCQFRPYKLNYDQYGLSVFESSSIISQNLIAATVIFHLKGDRYRTVVKNIRLIVNSEESQGLVNTLESTVYTRQQDMRFSIFRNISEILDKDFTSKTSFSKEGNDW